MNSRARLICAFVEPQAVGERFTRPDWPLHVTVVPWFRLTAPAAELNQALLERINNFEPFVARATSQSRTRYISNRNVSLLEPGPWQNLHKSLLGIVAQHAGTLATRIFTGRSYRPHVTFQKHSNLNPGDEFICDSLYVVEKQGRYREIVKRLIFGNDHEVIN